MAEAFTNPAAETQSLYEPEKVSIPAELYRTLCILGIIDFSGVRDSNQGESNYAQHVIQPWAIWKDWDLNPWDADIIKRVLRTKNSPGMSPTASRMMDYNKIIHLCEERLRQLDVESSTIERLQEATLK